MSNAEYRLIAAQQQHLVDLVMRNERIAREFGLGLVELQLLNLLLLHPDLTTARGLITLTGLPSSTVSDMVDRLARLGFLERRRSDLDRRAIILQPTEACNRIAERYRTSDLGAWTRHALENLSPEQIDGLVTYFTQLNEAAEHGGLTGSADAAGFRPESAALGETTVNNREAP